MGIFNLYVLKENDLMMWCLTSATIFKKKLHKNRCRILKVEMFINDYHIQNDLNLFLSLSKNMSLRWFFFVKIRLPQSLVNLSYDKFIYCLTLLLICNMYVTVAAKLKDLLSPCQILKISKTLYISVIFLWNVFLQLYTIYLAPIPSIPRPRPLPYLRGYKNFFLTRGLIRLKARQKFSGRLLTFFVCCNFIEGLYDPRPPSLFRISATVQCKRMS